MHTKRHNRNYPFDAWSKSTIPVVLRRGKHFVEPTKLFSNSVSAQAKKMGYKFNFKVLGNSVTLTHYGNR